MRWTRLSEADLAADPFEQFRIWYAEAERAGIPEPNAMTLATTGPSGRPSARMVLLKGVDDRGFMFYSNYRSRKGRELERMPWAALVLHWHLLLRQVRIEGRVAKLGGPESDAYFASRPRGAQLGTRVSPQSRPLPNQAVLEARMQEARARYRGREIPRPAHWGGYCVSPVAIEFWQGRPDRLHDRLLFTRARGSRWRVQRLAP